MDIYFDGRLRAGVVRTCVFLGDASEPSVRTWPNAARCTSGHAEWLAARDAVVEAAKQDDMTIVFKGDYENIFRHMAPSRDFTAKVLVAENVKLVTSINKIIASSFTLGEVIRWEHVARDENLAGLHLERMNSSKGSSKGALIETTISSTPGKSDFRKTDSMTTAPR